MSNNRREFFRLSFEPPIEAQVIKDDNIIPIEIENMSAGGMQFQATQTLPVEVNMKFSFVILEKRFEIDGYIVRKISEDGKHHYGVKFETNQATSSALFMELNNYAIRQRRGR